MADESKTDENSTGVSQLVLAVSFDHYDFAVRAELLGIGVWGNRKSAPNWTAEELGTVFLKVLGDGEEAISIHKKARDLGRIFQREPGRLRAAREIAKLARLG